MLGTPEEQAIHALDKRVTVLETEGKGLVKSLELQATEYERRLTELNHEHARSAENKANFVSDELFTAKQDETIKWRTDAEKWRSEVPGKYLTTESFAMTLQDWAKWRADMDSWRSRMIGFAIGFGIAGGLAGGGAVGLIIKLFQQP